MNVRIGVTYTAKEIDLEMPEEAEQDDVKKAVAEALESDEGVLWLTDRRGKITGVPSSKIAYVEIGQPEGRTIGFGG